MMSEARKRILEGSFKEWKNKTMKKISIKNNLRENGMEE